jgi:hypothetical protein
MDAVALCAALDDVRLRLASGDDVPVAEVEALLSQVPGSVEGSARADVAALKASVDRLLSDVRQAQTVLGEHLDRLGRGRRGNEGYRSLRANRKTQRLYRRA